MSVKSKETNVFIHPGVVSEIRDRSIIVSLDKNIHCESCSAKGACGVSDTGSKHVEIMDSEGSFKLNDPVEVILRKNLGHKAVFWAYIFPFILMLVTLLTTSYLFSEWIAGLLSLLVLIPYFTMVYSLKNYFKRTFRISVLKTY